MDINLLSDFVKGEDVPASFYYPYLDIYLQELGETEWKNILKTLWNRIEKTGSTSDESTAMLKKAIAFSLLLPVQEGVWHLKIGAENFVLKSIYYKQFKEKDWLNDFKQVVKKDIQIINNRTKALNIGIIDKLEWSSLTRQALNWLVLRAEEGGDIKEENREVVVRRLSNVVKAYGGLVVCNVFAKEPTKVDKVLNWRTGYFFEHLINETFTQEQILKIKTLELKKANPSLVKMLRS